MRNLYYYHKTTVTLNKAYLACKVKDKMQENILRFNAGQSRSIELIYDSAEVKFELVYGFNIEYEIGCFDVIFFLARYYRIISFVNNRTDPTHVTVYG
jgi:hypothetical protein